MNGKLKMISQPYLKCTHCFNTYTWVNKPYVLSCRHNVCENFLNACFVSSVSQDYSSVKVQCLECNKVENYPYCDDQESFISSNFIVDFKLLSYSYKYFPQNTQNAEDGKVSVYPQFNNMAMKVGHSIVNFTLDDTFVDNSDNSSEHKEEVPRPISKILGKISVYMANLSLHKEYCCFVCNRLFNKRNGPIKMKCNHNVCEICVQSNAKKIENDKKVLLSCTCGSGTVCVKLIKLPVNYPVYWIARKILKINKELLDKIYDEISIDAKKAAFEFSLRKSALNPELIERLCCHRCKNPFIGIPPFLLNCGHNTCLKCAFELVSEGTVIKCKLDKIDTTIKQGAENLVDLAKSLPFNSELKEYMDKNYSNTDEEYILDPEEENLSECQICYLKYDKKDHKQCSMCKNKHKICMVCLKGLIKKRLETTQEDIIAIECVTCREKTDIKFELGKKINDYIKEFIEN